MTKEQIEKQVEACDTIARLGVDINHEYLNAGSLLRIANALERIADRLDKEGKFV
jgi:hypothetical protein